MDFFLYLKNKLQAESSGGACSDNAEAQYDCRNLK